MGRFVVPDVHYLGCTGIDRAGLEGYLLASGNHDFLDSVNESRLQGLSDGEILCSFYAKLCYKSLTLGQNANVSRLRDIPDNLRGCIDQGHGSILEPVKERVRGLQEMIEREYRAMVAEMGLDTAADFAWKKKATSALRRLLPNGQSNEIGFSLNLRSLRHIVQLRTSRHAEWEIRVVFAQVYRLVKARHPLVFHGAREEEVDGLLEVSGMRMQPYEEREG